MELRLFPFLDSAELIRTVKESLSSRLIDLLMSKWKDAVIIRFERVHERGIKRFCGEGRPSHLVGGHFPCLVPYFDRG